MMDRYTLLPIVVHKSHKIFCHSCKTFSHFGSMGSHTISLLAIRIGSSPESRKGRFLRRVNVFLHKSVEMECRIYRTQSEEVKE